MGNNINKKMTGCVGEHPVIHFGGHMYADIKNGLDALVKIQKRVSGLAGAIPKPDEDVSNSLVTSTCFALQGEIFELAQELGWKYWANPKEMDHESVTKVADEFADVLAFLGLLVYLLERRTGLSSEDLLVAYLKKTDKNVERFLGKVSGYESPAGMA